MKYRESIDEVSMVEEEFVSETVEYDESEDMFIESEVMDYDMNMFETELDWSDRLQYQS